MAVGVGGLEAQRNKIMVTEDPKVLELVHDWCVEQNCFATMFDNISGEHRFWVEFLGAARASRQNSPKGETLLDYLLSIKIRESPVNTGAVCAYCVHCPLTDRQYCPEDFYPDMYSAYTVKCLHYEAKVLCFTPGLETKRQKA
ncbi:MAG: hypothetical protein UY48_C0005G0018 [Candidatus Gottesmanbacteria bacterium GW2011_GWB1_49_7]|uniref:Uncharacterized protein n=1 Tax=Candidatus Gottesmanbacteria bacterium GW2011_GWB1_49_7 TaxID=1618448 RepID=A0A0G1YDL4_9BACT|nr:MAG: hypothetical protein UY48_C0005G0018 [Candidatus Gottesmanbacteria bacterium GW2011_GWB1_49_7]